VADHNDIAHSNINCSKATDLIAVVRPNDRCLSSVARVTEVRLATGLPRTGQPIHRNKFDVQVSQSLEHAVQSSLVNCPTH
jgi:hypothetical protein